MSCTLEDGGWIFESFTSSSGKPFFSSVDVFWSTVFTTELWTGESTEIISYIMLYRLNDNSTTNAIIKTT